MSFEVHNTKDLCAILKACKKIGVKRLKAAGIEVEFISDQQPSVVSNGRFFEDPKIKNQIALNRKDEELSLMAIEDPIGYEKHLMSEDSEAEYESIELDA